MACFRRGVEGDLVAPPAEILLNHDLYGRAQTVRREIPCELVATADDAAGSRVAGRFFEKIATTIKL